MKTLEQGPNKIKKICDTLKAEAIEPAKKTAEKIIEEANDRAHETIKNGEKEVERLLREARALIEQERKVFQSSMQQAARLSIEALRQEIEEHVFSKELKNLVDQTSSDSSLVARLIEAVIQAIEKEGINANLTAIVPKTVNAKEVNQLLGEKILAKLKEKAVVLGDFAGGAKIKLHDKKITVDISDKALVDLFAGYAPSFRKFFFAG
jgi:V/A-type H+-transporting ATPase subunit E